MATIQVGNGWYDPKKGIYTVYDPNTGTLRSTEIDFARMINDMGGSGSTLGLMDAKRIAETYLRSGQISNLSQYTLDNPNIGGGRYNVNVARQIAAAVTAIKQRYPQMSKEQAMQYANNWVTDRIARGWDTNEIENMMKDVTRGESSINQDFINGVTSNISFDEFNDTPGNAIGETGVDPKLSIQDELRVFAESMMKTVGPDSPQAQRIAELAAEAGNRYATSSGMGPGGLTTRGVASTAARALTDLQTQREQIGLSALAAAGNQQLSVDQLKTQLQAQNQQAGVLNASGIGGLIGSGLGAIGGIVGAAYTNGAMAPAIPGLMQAGGSAGQAIGGIVQNSGAPPIQYGGQQQQTSSYRGRGGSTS